MATAVNPLTMFIDVLSTRVRLFGGEGLQDVIVICDLCGTYTVRPT